MEGLPDESHGRGLVGHDPDDHHDKQTQHHRDDDIPVADAVPYLAIAGLWHSAPLLVSLTHEDANFLECACITGRPVLLHYADTSLTAFFSLRYVSSIDSGITLVSAADDMKLVPPAHLGTTWACRWFGIPAPAAFPMFMPTLIPSGRSACSNHSMHRPMVRASSLCSSSESS